MVYGGFVFWLHMQQHSLIIPNEVETVIYKRRVLSAGWVTPWTNYQGRFHTVAQLLVGRARDGAGQA